MTRPVPVREIAHLQLAMPADDRWIETFSWIPVSVTELHLACRYYPVAVRFEKQKPRLGLLVHQRYLTHTLLDASGCWRGAYRPIALRCFPFEAPCVGDDPLSDIVIDANSEYLSPTAGVPIVDKAGRPERLLTEMHRLFCLLKRGQESFAGVLDQYLIAGLLVPLAIKEGAGTNHEPPFYVIDPTRLLRTDKAALGAMARHGFLSVDVAVACLFSLQNLRSDYRRKAAGSVSHQSFASPSIAPDTIMIDDLSLVLDDGELISLSDIDVTRPEVRPGDQSAPKPFETL
jgi:SapC